MTLINAVWNDIISLTKKTQILYWICVFFYAELVELADTTDLKSVVRLGVWVQIPYSAFFFNRIKAIKGTIKKAVKSWGGKTSMKPTLNHF